MREFKFRGKRIDNGEWVYGYFVKARDNTCHIIAEFGSDITCCSDCGANDITVYEVDPSTIGQYTGLNDKNGKEVYEGDIVRMHFFFENHHPVTLGAFEDEEEIVCKLSITPLGVYFENNNMTGYLCDYLEEPSEELEVIGNIHDNPELLGGEKDE